MGLEQEIDRSREAESGKDDKQNQVHRSIAWYERQSSCRLRELSVLRREILSDCN
jgi:hypothetical protein